MTIFGQGSNKSWRGSLGAVAAGSRQRRTFGSFVPADLALPGVTRVAGYDWQAAIAADANWPSTFNARMDAYHPDWPNVLVGPPNETAASIPSATPEVLAIPGSVDSLSLSGIRGFCRPDGAIELGDSPNHQPVLRLDGMTIDAGTDYAIDIELELIGDAKANFTQSIISVGNAIFSDSESTSIQVARDTVLPSPFFAQQRPPIAYGLTTRVYYFRIDLRFDSDPNGYVAAWAAADDPASMPLMVSTETGVNHASGFPPQVSVQGNVHGLAKLAVRRFVVYRDVPKSPNFHPTTE